MSSTFAVRPGSALPAGARVLPDGVNFSVFSRSATRLWLQLYHGPTEREPFQVIELTPDLHRTFFFWHVFVAGAGPGLCYTWRVDGPDDAETSGCRFDPQRELLDPWARAVEPGLWNRSAAIASADAPAIRGRVLASGGYDWDGDQPLQRPLSESVIYELHVGGFTRDPRSGVAAPGTFRGLIEKIPYLVELGITDVELLPVMAFDEQDVPPAVAERGLDNFWGYSPYGFFAPHPGYAESDDPRREFRDLVKALHRAGIGVILDVVFNHTAEGGEGGPTINFKGLGNEFFYHLDPADHRKYRDYTGCGNTINCNHPLVMRFILDCLEYWVREMHVDGFRLDLASVLARGEDGEPMYHAPVLWGMEFSSTLNRSHLIAEAWDAAGLYQVGDFPGYRWAEWNGDYRDVLRRFVRGDAGLIAQVASRVAGSSDLYAEAGRLPVNSINFVTCHDGFTLHDLVSYNAKHNDANGEGNRDGGNHDFSWNCGVEGPARKASILALRQQQARNFMAILMLSQGVPMMLAGDEVLRSQQGNNNAWCQDNALGWFDWSLADSNAAMLRFTRELIALRRRHPSLRRDRFLTGAAGSGAGGRPDICWHGAALDRPAWDDPQTRLLAFTLAGRVQDEAALFVVFNMGPDPVPVELPAGNWQWVVNTAQPSPGDVFARGEGPVADSSVVEIAARAVAVLESWYA